MSRPDRSNLTVSSGRFFAPTAPWNQPLGADLGTSGILTRRLLGLTVDAECGSHVVHVLDQAEDTFVAEQDRDGVVLRGEQARIPSGVSSSGDDVIVVDHRVRTVLSGRSWRRVAGDGWRVEDLEVVDLDGEGWGSDAVGLILERELLTIPEHAIGVWAPHGDFYGAWLRLGDVDMHTLDPVSERVAKAMQTYGGIISGIGAPGRLTIRLERSGAASSYDPVGPIYRQLGIGADPWPLGIPLEAFEVLV